MIPAVDSIWTAILKANELYSKSDDIEFDISPEKKKDFSDSFEQEYNRIKETYMASNVNFLDRHKVAAIIICTIIKERIIINKRELDSNSIFMGLEMIALSVGLSYMQRELNDFLRRKGETKLVNSYTMPIAMACDTDYFDILSRNLYFANRDYKLNPLDVADKLFLLEYITLKEKRIDPLILKESVESHE